MQKRASFSTSQEDLKEKFLDRYSMAYEGAFRQNSGESVAYHEVTQAEIDAYDEFNTLNGTDLQPQLSISRRVTDTKAHRPRTLFNISDLSPLTLVPLAINTAAAVSAGVKELKENQIQPSDGYSSTTGYTKATADNMEDWCYDAPDARQSRNIKVEDDGTVVVRRDMSKVRVMSADARLIILSGVKVDTAMACGAGATLEVEGEVGEAGVFGASARIDVQGEGIVHAAVAAGAGVEVSGIDPADVYVPY